MVSSGYAGMADKWVRIHKISYRMLDSYFIFIFKVGIYDSDLMLI